SRFVHSSMPRTINVTNTNDSGPGSLRQALMDAVDGDQIAFLIPPGTITLTSGQLIVSASVIIGGYGADSLTVDGNFNDRVFYINAGLTVTISGLTLTKGNATGPAGCIYNDHSALTVTSCTLSNSATSGNGGGIYNDHGIMTATNCTISGNSAKTHGGGIYNSGGGGNAMLTISNSTLSGNTAF